MNKELQKVLDQYCKMLKPACPLPEAWYIYNPSAIVYIHTDNEDPIYFEIIESGKAGSTLLTEEEFLTYPKPHKIQTFQDAVEEMKTLYGE